MLRLIFDFLSADDIKTNDPQNVDSLKSIIEQEFTELCRKKISIPDSTVDLSITLADSASEYLIIACDQEITIKLNSSSDSLTLTPRTAKVKSIVFFAKSNITDLKVSNASGEPCNIDVISVNL